MFDPKWPVCIFSLSTNLMVNVEVKSLLKKNGINFNAKEDMDLIRGGQFQLTDCQELSGTTDAPFIFINAGYYGGLEKLKIDLENG